MAALVLSLSPGAALGQARSPTDAEALRLREQQEEQARERQRGEPSVRQGKKTAPGADSVELPAETPCFPIRELRLEGDEGHRFGWLREYLGRYAGKCIGLQGINLIADRLTAQIVGRGYVTTRVGIPEQRIADGAVRFVLVPGVIRSIQFADSHTRGSWRTAFPARPGDLLEIHDLDQGMEQLKRVPSQDAEMEIRPGKEPGESDVLVVLRRQKPWRASVSVDDSGSAATGKQQATAVLSLDDPLALNDLLSVTVSHDVAMKEGDRGTQGASLFYSVPFGYWTATLNASANKYHQRVAGQAQSFTYRGDNLAADATVQRVIHRSQSSKTGLQLSLSRRWAHTYLEDTEILVQHRNMTTLALELSHRHFLGPAVVDATLGHHQGVPWFGKSPVDDQGGPHDWYRYETLDLNLTAPLPFLRYVLRGRAQYAGGKLFVPDQLSIGGRYTVRGFDGERTLIAERGWYLRNELALPLARTDQEVYAGADYGEVSGPSASSLLGKRLAGGVAGARGRLWLLTYDVFAGWPLLWPKGFHTERPALGFMVTCQL